MFFYEIGKKFKLFTQTRKNVILGKSIIICLHFDFCHRISTTLGFVLSVVS